MNEECFTYIWDFFNFLLVLLTGSTFSGMTICPVAAARELFVFLPVLTGGSGGGSPLWLAEEFFDRLSWLLERLDTFWGIACFSCAELLSELLDEADLDLK